MTRKGKLPDDFCEEKIGLLRRLLALDEIFPAGIDVDNESLDSFVELTERLSGASPRPLLADLELMAIAIHARYNEHQLERNPAEPLAYPNFSDLPDNLKYSNLRQAQAIYERLEAAGYALRQAGGKGALYELPDEVVEQLARVEHDDWVAERKASGWTLGPRDPEKRTTPHLVPYDELTEEIKELDRDAIRNIPELARSMHLAIYEL